MLFSLTFLAVHIFFGSKDKEEKHLENSITLMATADLLITALLIGQTMTVWSACCAFAHL